MRAIQLPVRRLARVWIRFQRDRRGDVAIIFALALIPILAFVGAAVDYSRANAMKADLQAALDSTALMVSKNAATQTGSALQTSAQSYFTALFTNTQAQNLQFTASYSSTGGSSVAVNGSADMPTTFMAILGFKTITVTGSSTAKWGSIAAARGAGARHHRLDGRRRQDRRAQDRDQKSADPIATRRRHRWRRLCVDHPVQQGRQCRGRQFQRDLGRLERLGCAAEPDAEPVIRIRPGLATPAPSAVPTTAYTCTTGQLTAARPRRRFRRAAPTRAISARASTAAAPSRQRNSHYYNGCYNSTTYSCTGSSCSCTGHSNCSCSGSGNNKTCRDGDRGYLRAHLDQERAYHLERLRHRPRQFDRARHLVRL